MDVHEQFAADRFWHGGNKTTFAKEWWRDPCSGLWKRQDPVLIWVQGMSVFFHRMGIKPDGFQNIWSDVSSREMPALMTLQLLMTS